METQILPVTNLPEIFDEICVSLGVSSPPRIAWQDETKSRFLGTYCPKHHNITISRNLSPEFVKTVIVHELCHSVLIKLGYRSVGHSAIFLATYQLFLIKTGLGDTDSIEFSAANNWNTWTPWPHWYRHITDAQTICIQLQKDESFVIAKDAQEIATAVRRERPHKRWIPNWCIHRWHEIIGDTRGNWYALWHLSRLIFFTSFALILVPNEYVKKAGAGLFVLGYLGLWLSLKVFKLDRTGLVAGLRL